MRDRAGDGAGDRRTGGHGFLPRSGGELEDGEREGRRQARNPERKLLRNPQREMIRTELRKASAIPFVQVTRRKEPHVCGSADGNPQLLSLQVRKTKDWAAGREVGGKSPQFRLLRAADWPAMELRVDSPLARRVQLGDLLLDGDHRGLRLVELPLCTARTTPLPL